MRARLAAVPAVQERRRFARHVRAGVRALSGKANRPDRAGVKTLVLPESIGEINGVAS